MACQLSSRVDAARFLGISLRTLDRLVEVGELTPVRVGRRVLFEQAEIERFIDTIRKERG
ncbi:MAG: helix-turn-helix domain-containing protein [Myxococcota bacterium]|jgi:excisionase family DNA binding protein|nr:helix-turn-helix domain-containing protein [Myxococcota bacterium]